ncbi:MAG: UDP-N-acetylmuramate dehydrogenase [Acidimicrobiia bacterium]|nr:UDP-N-acetylmuramate dehydrogenase [Acidimicrobiia bacterium]
MTSRGSGIDHRAVRSGVALAPLTTYKVGGEARWFAEPKDLEDLRSILEVVPPDTPTVVLGRGSNVVVSDDGIDGLVLRLGHGFSSLDIRADGTIVAGGGLPLPKLARAAAEAGRSGLGFYVGIPGSVGGAVRMNAGGHGSDTAAVLVSVVVVNMGTGELTTRSSADLDLGYRSSNLADSDIVVQASFTTTDGDQAILMAELREITRWRKEHQPGGTLNAGSVFKNPPNRAAGEIIDSLGLKGYAVGPVRVSEIHANFMVAEPEANATDIWTFVHNIQRTVHERTGIFLEPEVKFLGAFCEKHI